MAGTQAQAGPPGAFDSRQRVRYDGRNLRTFKQKKVFDHTSGMIKRQMLRSWHMFHERMEKRLYFIQPDPFAMPEMVPSSDTPTQPILSVPTMMAGSVRNTDACPTFCCAWYPDGRQLLTGNQKGQLTMWNAVNFGFVTIQDSHLGEQALRAMKWSGSALLLLTGGSNGEIKLWNPQLRELHCIERQVAHTDCVRALTISPTDAKLASASDDGKAKTFDVATAREEFSWPGHGAPVKTIDWHSTLGLLATGGQDNTVKFWDPRTGDLISTLYEHKSTVNKVEWNRINGNWLLSASKDTSVKVFDIRTMRLLQTFTGHTREITSCTWHPYHETLCASAGYDGGIKFFNVGAAESLGEIEQAHEGSIWDIAFHPVGHLIASVSHDKTARFWARNRPGSNMQDRYNAPFLPEPTRSEAMAFYRIAGAVKVAAPTLRKGPVVDMDRDRRNMPSLKPSMLATVSSAAAGGGGPRAAGV